MQQSPPRDERQDSVASTDYELIDTEAERGNFLVHPIEKSARGRRIDHEHAGGRRGMHSQPDKQRMTAYGHICSTEIPLAFPPEDRVCNVAVTAVKGLPYGLLGPRSIVKMAI